MHHSAHDGYHLLIRGLCVCVRLVLKAFPHIASSLSRRGEEEDERPLLFIGLRPTYPSHSSGRSHSGGNSRPTLSISGAVGASFELNRSLNIRKIRRNNGKSNAPLHFQRNGRSPITSVGESRSVLLTVRKVRLQSVQPLVHVLKCILHSPNVFRNLKKLTFFFIHFLPTLETAAWLSVGSAGRSGSEVLSVPFTQHAN
ncbi:hypothetical protein EYF80_058408 [Liparis tanakae]|uniref:Uncharacterized protein n=1 Tax=Liparis tanakae TaxID=230148 RepID=A0A4Z2ES58_9TELE|nr:hypothetical protein EYF80_058408 [Liparis tanakae]